MNAMQHKSDIAIRESANHWAARLADPGMAQAEKAAFAAWLRASPVHVREYLQAEALRTLLGDTLRRNAADIDDLLRDEPSNVVPLAGRGPDAASDARQPRRARAQLALAATVLLGFGVILGAYLWSPLAPGNYSTAVGEIRSIALPDGSTLELNTGSRVRIDFDEHRRDIQLLRGEAFFTVVRDVRRPFRVMSDAALVRALGTQFSVHRKAGATVVTVVQGRVAAQSAGHSLELAAGQQAVVDTSADKPAVTDARLVDAGRLTAWRQHRLIFNNQPLAEVIAEFNRYNRRQLVVEDPELAAQGISGIFDPDKPQGLLLFLEKKGGVKASGTPGGDIVLSR